MMTIAIENQFPFADNLETRTYIPLFLITKLRVVLLCRKGVDLIGKSKNYYVFHVQWQS